MLSFLILFNKEDWEIYFTIIFFYNVSLKLFLKIKFDELHMKKIIINNKCSYINLKKNAWNYSLFMIEFMWNWFETVFYIISALFIKI